MTDYANMLRWSGYSEKFRRDTVKGIMDRWETVVSDVNENKRSLHRSTEDITIQKEQRGTSNNSTWFLKRDITTTMTVPITPSSSLRNKIQQRLANVRGPDGGRTVIMEESGKVITRSVPRPGQPKGCHYVKKCGVRSDTNCQTMGVIYEVKCKDCPNPVNDGDVPNKYIGTSAFSLHYRSSLHMKDIKGAGEKTSNSMLSHNKKYHKTSVNNHDRFEFAIISTHTNLMERLLTESHTIQTSGLLMNGKNEWGASKWIHLDWTKTNT